MHHLNSTTYDFVRDSTWLSMPGNVHAAARRALLDLLGVAAAGTQTTLSQMIHQHAHAQFAANDNPVRMLFDGRSCSAVGAAMAGGMQIDSVDAHDGHKLTKGHVGCGVLPAVLAAAEYQGKLGEQDLLGALVVGYEVGTRAGIALHRSVPDYHTSGAWVAVAAAAVVTRILDLNVQLSREAMGIAEFHGPRSQMMRCIDHPTMVKDGSGWGAMAGVSAALLARDGFTGAPAVTIEAVELADIWSDLGSHWMITEQYSKCFPVCRWAQPAICAVLALRRQYGFAASAIAAVYVNTFHQARRLANRAPQTTEQAQYSLPFPVAVALVHGSVGVAHIDGDGLRDSDVLALSSIIELNENEAYNQAFPARRISDVTIELKDGRKLHSGATEADGDPESPLADSALDAKYLELATMPLGKHRAETLLHHVRAVGTAPTLDALNQLLYAPTITPSLA